MSSVQELLMAARAQQRPSMISQLGEVANTALGAYDQGRQISQQNQTFQDSQQMHRIAMAKAMLEMQQQKEQMATDQVIRDKVGQTFQQTINDGRRTDATPTGKLVDEFGPNGQKLDSASAPMIPPADPAPMTPPPGAPNVPPVPAPENLVLDNVSTDEHGHLKPTFKRPDKPIDQFYTPEDSAMAALPTATDAERAALASRLTALHPDRKVPKAEVDTMATSINAAANRDATNNRFLQGQSNIIDTQARQAYLTEKAPLEQAVMDTNRNAGLIADAATNPSAASAVPVALADAFTKRMSPEILSRFGGSKAILDRAEQTASEWASGKNSPQNLAYMQELNNTLKDAAQKNLQQVGIRHAQMRVQRAGGTTADNYLFLTGQPLDQGASPQGGAPATTGAVTHRWNPATGQVEAVQ